MKSKNKLKRSNKFGVKVRIRLIELGMTQSELAEMVGTSQRYMNHLICGYRNPSDKYIEEIEKALKISLNDYKRSA